jgi:hypothetical protein
MPANGGSVAAASRRCSRTAKRRDASSTLSGALPDTFNRTFQLRLKGPAVRA